MTPAKMLIMVGKTKRLNLMTANQSNVETDTTGITSFNVTIERTSEKSLYGNYSLKATPNGSGATEDVAIYVPAEINKIYTIKVNLWIPTGHNVQVALDWTQNMTWRQVLSSGTVTGNDSWKSFSATGICPDTANRIKITFRRTSNSDTTPYYYDGGIVEQSDNVGDYNDYYNLS